MINKHNSEVSSTYKSHLPSYVYNVNRDPRESGYTYIYLVTFDLYVFISEIENRRRTTHVGYNVRVSNKQIIEDGFFRMIAYFNFANV